MICVLVTRVNFILPSLELRYFNNVLKDQCFWGRSCMVKSTYLWQFELKSKSDCLQCSCLLNKLLLKVVVFDARWHGFNTLTRQSAQKKIFLVELQFHLLSNTPGNEHHCIHTLHSCFCILSCCTVLFF